LAIFAHSLWVFSWVFGENMSIEPIYNDEWRSLLQKVLIVDDDPQRTQALSAIVERIGSSEIFVDPLGSDSLQSVRQFDPNLILVAYRGMESDHQLDGVAFTRALRWSRLRARKLPVIAYKTIMSQSELIEARDAGVHEVLSLPFAWQDLVRRLEIISQTPRNWIEAEYYVGPDRRRFNSAQNKTNKPQRRNEDQNPAHPSLLAARRIQSKLTDWDQWKKQALDGLRNDLLILAQGLIGAGDSQTVQILRKLMLKLNEDDVNLDNLRGDFQSLTDMIESEKPNMSQDFESKPEIQTLAS
jgi:CheY-like chemotaxis protein